MDILFHLSNSQWPLLITYPPHLSKYDVNLHDFILMTLIHWISHLSGTTLDFINRLFEWYFQIEICLTNSQVKKN